MKRTISMALALVAATAGIAVAGDLNDDDNDYEGRVNQNEETYFGFDLSPNGKRVSGITAYLHYNCGGKQGNLIVETDGELKVDEDGKFSGKTKGQSKIDVTYKTTGKLRGGGKARGTIKASGALGDTKCKSPNDGDWSAKEGRDIDLDTRSAR